MSNRERTIESKGRIEFIDLAKGICILLVVMIHVGVPEYIPGLYAAKVPIFFLLSGLFFLKKVNFFLRGGNWKRLGGGNGISCVQQLSFLSLLTI